MKQVRLFSSVRRKQTLLMALLVAGLVSWSGLVQQASAETDGKAAQQPAAKPQTQVAPQPESQASAGKSKPEFCLKANEGQKRSSTELVECIKQPKNPDRVLCMEQALCTDSPPLRGEAIAAIYFGQEHMVFDVLAPANDEAAYEELSKLGRFGIYAMKWDGKGKSFHGYCTECAGNFEGDAYGQVTGDQLTVGMKNIYRFIGENKEIKEVLVQCTVSVKLNKDLSALEGEARCSGVKPVFKARLGFG